MKRLLIAVVLTGTLAAQSAAELVATAARMEGSEAVALLRQALAQDDNYAAAHYLLGVKLNGLKQYAEAETHFARAISRISASDPKVAAHAKALALTGWAKALVGQDKLEEAERRLKESLAEERAKEAEDLLTTIRTRNGGAVVSAKAITRSLSAEAADGLGPDAPPPSIDLVIHFDYNKDEIKPEGEAQALQLAEAIKTLDGKRFRIIGHTDRHGDDAYNDDLSRRRASRVRARLIQSGIAPDRLEAEGQGKRAPLNTQATAEADAVNRRVEVQLLR